MSVELVNGLPALQLLPNGRRELIREFRVVVDGRLIVVPKGFDTDLSSIPWFARSLVRFDKVDIAGIAHDWLYRTGIGGRRWADYVWREVALAGPHHANKMQANVAWMALRVSGWWKYKQYKNARPAWRK